MVPLVAALVKWGFGTIASVVASKGKDLVEQKLGINLDDALGTEQGRIQLKQLEIQHEEFLLGLTQATEARDLDYFKEETEDKQNARAREIEIEKTRGAPWWAPSTLTLLTFLVVCGGGFIFYQIKDESARYVIVSLITMVLSYYYGTTSHSGNKDNILASLLGKRGPP